MLQGFWKGVLPSIVMVSNPSVNYMLYEYLRARLEDWRRVLSVDDGKFRRTSPAGAIFFLSSRMLVLRLCLDQAHIAGLACTEEPCAAVVAQWLLLADVTGVQVVSEVSPICCGVSHRFRVLANLESGNGLSAFSYRSPDFMAATL